MKVLAIDPSTTSLGWAVLRQEDEEDIILEDFNALQFDDSETLLSRLNSIYSLFFKIVSDHPDITDLMLEKTFKVDRGTIALATAIKIIRETAESVIDLNVHQENAMRVRAYFKCGARKSEVAKEKVKEYVLGTFIISDTLVSDAYDAIILGMYCLEKNR